MKNIPERTNVVVHENGIISFTREITWLNLMETGWGNGYVALPEGHKFYGTPYDDVDVEIHGGLTYGETEEIDGKDYWVLGFDCCHYRDNKQTNTEQWLITEVQDLVNQLSAKELV